VTHAHLSLVPPVARRARVSLLRVEGQAHAQVVKGRNASFPLLLLVIRYQHKTS
jgi:hypothetical protein